MVQIKCENVTVGYGSSHIVENINFEVNKGDYLYIVGENGVGKTTLLKTLLGVRPILNGFVEIESSSKIGYLPQQNSIQTDFPATVKEIVLSGYINSMGFRPFYTKKEKSKALLSARKMGILDLKNTYYKDLTNEQQQMVLMARALCATGELMFLDEPTKNLNRELAGEMFKIITKINKKGTTIVVVSSEIEKAIESATHILHLGRSNFFGTVEEYKQSDVGKNYLKSYNVVIKNNNQHINL